MNGSLPVTAYWFTAMLAAMFLTAGVVSSPAKERAPRLALIITNADYSDKIGRLVKTHEDGRIIATALRDVGFSHVRHVKDADFQTTRLALADFITRIERAGPTAVVFFYYAGHGAADHASRGENFIIPVNAQIESARQLPLLGIGLSEIIRALESVPAKARFAVIDACRDVAFTRGLRSAARGFVPMRAADDILIAFSTKPGQVALDENVFSSALAKHIRQPGIAPYSVFKRTQLTVAQQSKGNQVPWIEDGLLVQDFRFKPGRQKASLTPPNSTSKPAPADQNGKQNEAGSSTPPGLSGRALIVQLQLELLKRRCMVGRVGKVGKFDDATVQGMRRIANTAGQQISWHRPTAAALRKIRALPADFMCFPSTKTPDGSNCVNFNADRFCH